MNNNSSVPLNVKETVEFLKAHDDYLILIHSSPDGDAVGSGYGLLLILKELGKRAKVLCPDPIPQKFSIIIPKCDDEDFEPKTIVSTDLADYKLLGNLRDLYKDKVELCIDHHISNVNYSKNILLDPEASAACECIYHIAINAGVFLSKELVNAIYAGIVTDTGCFKFSNTTARTHTIAAHLIEAGADYAQLNKHFMDTKSKERVKMESLALGRAEFFFNGLCSVITLTDEMFCESGCEKDDTDGINALSNTIEGVIAGVTIKEKDGTAFKVSLRTNAPINASEICRTFGGGGHIRAAGCEIKSDSLENAKKMILEEVKLRLEEAGCQI